MKWTQFHWFSWILFSHVFQIWKCKKKLHQVLLFIYSMFIFHSQNDWFFFVCFFFLLFLIFFHSKCENFCLIVLFALSLFFLCLIFRSLKATKQNDFKEVRIIYMACWFIHTFFVIFFLIFIPTINLINYCTLSSISRYLLLCMCVSVWFFQFYLHVMFLNLSIFNILTIQWIKISTLIMYG